MNWTLDENGIHRQNNLVGKISYHEEGNDALFEIEDNSSWFNQRNDLIIALIKKYPFKGDFLDIGGGNGFQARQLKKSNLADKVILCEPGYSGCLNAKKNNVEYIYNGIFQEFPFESFNIKAIGLFDVIEHIESDSRFLNELYQLLPVRAKVYITVPALKFLWSEIDPLSGHYRRYNGKELKRLISEVPFKLIDSGYYFNFYILPLFILRVLPFYFGIRRGWDKIIEGEKKSHTQKNGITGKIINKLHQRSLDKLCQGRKARAGTSIYIVFEKVI
jgi:hypothetical protein